MSIPQKDALDWAFTPATGLPQRGWMNRLLGRFLGLGLLYKTLIANSLVVLGGAVVGTYLTRRLADLHSSVTLAAAFFLCGAVVTMLVNYLAFWDHFRPLLAISRALEAIRHGQEARAAIEGVRATGVGTVVESVRVLLDRIEDGSLQFTARLLGSIEADRRRIGRELHDDISQIIAAALLKLEKVERQLPAGRQSLSEVRQLLEISLDQLKSVMYDLRPAMLDDVGLEAALRWYVKARADRPGLELVTHFDVTAPRLPPHLETAIYRVGQEALTNALRHSEATRVELNLEIRPGYAALAVFDNGKGFDREQARGHGIGLLSMRERITLLDGKFNIVSEPGQGTRVYAVVPRPEESTNSQGSAR